MRNNCFDFLRFVFAFVVVCGHLIVISGIPEIQCFKPFFNTYLAVLGFFVISGFLIHQSYLHSHSITHYFSKRAKRLLPAYWIVILGCALGLFFLSDLSYQKYFFSADWWKYLGANLSFLNSLHPSLPGVFNNHFVNDNSVNPALWTLKIEVAFYFCVPLFVWLQRKSKRPWILFIILYIGAVAYDNVFTTLATQQDSTLLSLLSHQLPAYLSYFAIGMALSTYLEWFLINKNKLILPALLVFAVEFYLGVSFFTPLAYGIMVIWCAYSLEALNQFAKYGDISYGIYIYHAPILKVLLTLGFFATNPLWMTIPCYLILVSTIGLLSWHLVEKIFLHR